MSEAEAVYRIIQRLEIPRWSDDLQRTVTGWEVKAKWLKTGTVLTVFVPSDLYTAENLDVLLRTAGAKDEQVERLGA
jgi:hypothetical protein